MHILFKAWMTEKKQHEVLTFRRANGDLIEHYPNGVEKVIEYAKPQV